MLTTTLLCIAAQRCSRICRSHLIVTILREIGEPERAAETCELVIMDRGFDPVAPIIHDWTYEPMVYDLLAPEGSTYRYHAENNKGA